MYKIGELSKLCRIPVKTLRYYDGEGLLRPDKTDELTGYRYYSAARLSDCYKILALKELGFTLEEIKAQFSMPREQLSLLIAAKERELLALQSSTERRINILRELQSDLKEDKSMFDIVIKKSDEIRVAYERKIIPDRKRAGEIISEMRSKIPAEIIGGRTVVIDYETEFGAGSFDAGFGVEITGRLPVGRGLSEKIIGFSEDTASLICAESDYDKAVAALGKYVSSNNFQIVGAVYKITYDDGTVEIRLPVVKLGEFNPDKNESLDVPFEDDPAVIGRWEMVDLLPCREMFDPRKFKSEITGEPVRELYFLPNGERYWCFGWTKDYLLSSGGYPHRKSRNRYTIEETAFGTFMLVEFKGYNYFEGGKPEIWVLKKADSKAYTKREIMITDKIPDVPADDKRVIGKWSVCGLVRRVEDFNPENPSGCCRYEDLFWRSAEFSEGGGMVCEFKDSDSGEVYADKPDVWRWVTGSVICKPMSTVSRYRIEEIFGREYLFIQWKSGDYVYGGDEPFHYVFVILSTNQTIDKSL